MGFHQSRHATAAAAFGSPSAAALATGLPVPFGQSSVDAVEVIITAHACQRYIERVGPADLSMAEACACIRAHQRALEAAVKLNCHSIRLACGARLIVKNGAVVTVSPAQPKLDKAHGTSIQRSGQRFDFRAVGRRLVGRSPKWSSQDEMEG